VERKPGESSNDRNDRAIRVAVKWYNHHFTQNGTASLFVILITEDADNAAKAKEENIIVFSGKLNHIKCSIYYYVTFPVAS